MHCIFKKLSLPIWGMIFIGSWLLAVPVRTWALDEVTYEASMDKEKAKIGENVQYLITVNFGKQTMVPNITAPTFNQFEVVNTFQSVQTKGEEPDTFQVLKKIWLLRPNEPGKLSIAAAIITFQDPTSNLLKNGKTQVQFLDVASADNSPTANAASAPESSPANPSPAAGGKQPLFLALAGGVALVVLLLVVLLLRRPGARKTCAEDEALRGLDEAIGHAERENLEAYYAALTRAFLGYLQNKFAVDGDLLSTPALLAQMQACGFGAAVLSELEKFLKTTDRAKFAGYVPNEDEMIVLHGIVKKFIEAGRRIRVKSAPAAKKAKRGEDED